MRQGLESRGLLGKERQTWGPHLTALLAKPPGAPFPKGLASRSQWETRNWV